MKKFAAPVLAVLWLGVLFSGAASAAEKTVSFGLKGSLVFSHQSNSAAEGEGYSVESKVKSRYALGIFADIRMSERFCLQPEILYSRKGSRQDLTVDDLEIGNIRTDLFMDYIEIPVVLKVYPFKRNGLVDLFVCAGAYGAFLTVNEFQLSNTYLGEYAQEIEDLTGTDFGVVFGAGLEIDSLGRRWGFVYRYTLGLTDLVVPAGEYYPEIELRNRCHTFTVEMRLF